MNKQRAMRFTVKHLFIVCLFHCIKEFEPAVTGEMYSYLECTILAKIVTK